MAYVKFVWKMNNIILYVIYFIEFYGFVIWSQTWNKREPLKKRKKENGEGYKKENEDKAKAHGKEQ
jgi:hypothetical protein